MSRAEQQQVLMTGRQQVARGRGARRRENSVNAVVNEAGEEQRVSVRGVGGPRGAPVMVPPRLVAS